MPISPALEPGTVIAIRGTLDKRDDTVRATAQKVKVLTPESVEEPAANGTARVREEEQITLRFGAGIGSEELRTVREILASSPGSRPVTLLLTSCEGETVRIETGETCRIAFTPGIEEQLAPWL